MFDGKTSPLKESGVLAEVMPDRTTAVFFLVEKNAEMLFERAPGITDMATTGMGNSTVTACELHRTDFAQHSRL